MIGMEGRTLRSERLCCRLLEETDKPALRALLSDEAVTFPAGFHALKSEEETDTFFRTLTRYRSAVALLTGGTLIGYLHATRMLSDHPDYRDRLCVSIGIVIGKEYQRRGYGPEALSLFTADLKERFDFCFAEHFLENEASHRVILRCGYRYLESCRLFLDALGCEKDCLRYVL